MLEKTNPGIVTYSETDEMGCSKYLFMSLAVSIQGFRATCHLVLCVDRAFLKINYGGTMLAAIAQDANMQLYSIAFGAVDSENNES
ncbi:hypothetical protein TorRG33x02_295700 [Trema orientale]|uniref:Uncharacterized protein n=1 Tax=Trema orientale TaxID=63057 RepID=A0A2P5C6I0_TREOI|nr:hypothetical protein TorRG33x02_295700 [Trema orientale]